MAAALILLTATAAQAQTLTTTNIEKEVSTENAGMRIYMDWPVNGPQKLVDDVRNYIIGVLRDRAGGKRYTGDPANGQAIATFYAKELYKEQAEMAAEYDVSFNASIFFSKESESTTVVTYKVSTYDPVAGNYGYNESSVTFSAATGKPLTEVIDRSRANNAILQFLLRRGLISYFQQGSDEPVNLYGYYLSIEEGEPIPLPETEPMLTADGVTFRYREYEITRHRDTPEFTIPLSEIKPFLSDSAKELVK